VTEAGYLHRPDGSVDLDDPALRADLAVLRSDPSAAVGTMPGQLLAGLQARRSAGAGPLTVVPCDNLPDNRSAAAAVLGAAAAEWSPDLAGWIAENVSFVSTMVDRITPATSDSDPGTAEALTGFGDAAPVVTEPFSEWVLAGEFPAGRPDWEAAGARCVAEVEPFQQRKLWLLNGAHSLLAYAGELLGHTTVAEAIADDRCRVWVQQWWDEAARELSIPSVEYRSALLDRFGNPRMRHLLQQIAVDGSQKIGVRILPVLRRCRARGELPGGALRVIAAWILQLRDGRPTDAQVQRFSALATGELSAAVAGVLAALDPALAADPAVRDGVEGACQELASVRSR
jgi:fructuronate reductase